MCELYRQQWGGTAPLTTAPLGGDMAAGEEARRGEDTVVAVGAEDAVTKVL
uniref:Uncharacterized protein n=1 Tax=Arundo donax TaxID=35708 RepID=A0A0A9HTK9_ARUDO